MSCFDCACWPLPSFTLALRKISSWSGDPEDGREIYGARYRPRDLGKPLPQLLIAALAKVSPEAKPLHNHRISKQSPACVRDSQKVPKHFLHGTLGPLYTMDPAIYYFLTDEQGVVSKVLVWWGLKDDFEGPPNFCHGGMVSSLMDDAFGAFTNTHLRSLGHSGEAVTAYLHVDFKLPTPIPGDVVCVAELDDLEGRKVFVKGQMLTRTGGEWLTTCEAKALFVELKEGFAGMKQNPATPEGADSPPGACPDELSPRVQSEGKCSPDLHRVESPRDPELYPPRNRRTSKTM